ncbi:MAG: autotransporter assembly complex protein TamA [Methylomonas sp.]
MSKIAREARIAWIITILGMPGSVAAEVIVSGVNGLAKENTEVSLSLRKQDCAAPEWKIRRLFGKADQEIDEALRAVGYYHAHIKKKDLDFKDKCWQARFEIEPGSQVIVDRIDIDFIGDAQHDSALQQLREKLLAKTGTPLNHGHYEQMKKQIESLAMARGYLKGSFVEKTLLIDKANDKADITLVYDGKDRLQFGDVAIEQDILNPEFVEKFVSIKSGDYYSSEEMVKTQAALSKSEYFDTIDIHPEMDNIDRQRVPIDIKLYPKKRHQYAFGAGFDTDKGPLVSASYRNRRINREGHFLNSDLDISKVLSTAFIEYTIPLEDPIRDQFSFGGGAKREDTDTYKSLEGKLSARLKHTYDSGWQQTLFLDWLYENFTIDTEPQDTLLLVPGGTWLRSVSDNPMRPKRGYRLEFNIAGSYKNPISEASFAQGSASAVWMHPVFDQGRVIVRGEQGVTAVDDFGKLPTTYRFYAGGMNSIRGYAYKELGPKNARGRVVGGQFLSMVSLEYEHAVLENWGAAAFIDSGNAYNLDSISIKTGVGLGVRWYSPIGLVRLDFALPLDQAKDSFQIHFAAGARL